MFCFDNFVRSAKSLRNQSNEANAHNFIPNGACYKLEHAINFTEQSHLYSDLHQLRETPELLDDLRCTPY